ncbi:MAG: hypothetical protein QM736_28515 [Vicinamibacterales bacterium]
MPAGSILAVAIVFQFMWHAPVVRAMPDEGWAARADVRFAKEAASQLPPQWSVLTQNPGMFHLWGTGAGQMSRVVGNGPLLAYLAQRYAGGVYVHWNFWCNTDDPVQQDICGKAMAAAPTTLVRETRYVANDSPCTDSQSPCLDGLPA